jgi:hypothetical protein
MAQTPTTTGEKERGRDKELLKTINASGFPFQLRVADLVERTASRHGWRVLVREHPWTDPETGKASFIDLVLARDRDSVRLVVECKRAQEGQWVFLPHTETETTAFTQLARGFLTTNSLNGRKTSDWVDCHFKPPSAESSFCAVRGTGDGDRPLLERLAAQVSRATEVFGRQELAVERPGSLDLPTLYVPVIVSNVELVLCDADTSRIDIATGSLSSSEVSFKTEAMVRFRKPLATQVDLSRFDDVSSINRDAERTVFVVNSVTLPDCLREFRLESVLPDSPRGRFA